MRLPHPVAASRTVPSQGRGRGPRGSHDRTTFYSFGMHRSMVALRMKVWLLSTCSDGAKLYDDMHISRKAELVKAKHRALVNGMIMAIITFPLLYC